MFRQFAPNEFRQDAQNGCGQHGDSALELWHCRLGLLNMKSVHSLQSMVSDMNLGKILRPTSLLVCECALRVNNIGRCFPMKGEGNDYTFANYAFGCVWPHEDHIHGQLIHYIDL